MPRKSTRNWDYSLSLNSSLLQNISILPSNSFIADCQSQVTILAWVRYNIKPQSLHYIWIANVGFPAQNCFIYLSNVTGLVTVGVADGTSLQDLTSTESISPYNWSLIGMSYRLGGNLSVITNNTIKSVSATKTLQASSIQTFIGNNSTNTLDGNISRFIIFKNEISQSQLDGYYYDDVIPQLNKAIYYEFNEGSGATITDSSGNSNTGTLNGGILWSNDTPFKNRNDVA